MIARSFRAEAHLLIIDPETPALRVAEACSFQGSPPRGQEWLDLGLSRLRRLGVKASGELVRGEPAQLITSRAKQLGIDLIVLAHRRQSFLERWWSGPRGAYIVDGVSCSVLVARDTITDVEFERYLAADATGE